MNHKRTIHKRTIFLITAITCAFFMVSCSTMNTQNRTNPHKAQWVKDEIIRTLETIKRIDEKGALYEMTYTADYYDTAITDIAKKVASSFDAGCSAFSTYNTSGEYMLCRNYDYRHKDTKGNYTGLNVIIHTAPEGKLKSVGVCDAYWLNASAYYSGALDDGKTDTSLMVLAPYMCVDGMNEAGVTASLLVTDLKAGETYTKQNTGKTSVPHSILLRYIMDNAHSVEEAAEIAGSFDVCSTGVSDLHMYVTDKSGTSAVFEWRQYGDDDRQKLYVTYTNAVTNFFVGFDDGEDYYKDGSLKELFTKITPSFNGYRYGFGHGYHRFNAIVATLERFIQPEDNGHGIRNSVMKENQVLDVLRVVSQDPGVEKTSFTQYSAVYNLENLTINMWVQKDFDRVYEFGLE